MNRLLSFLVLPVFLVLLSRPALAAAYYVSPSGSNTSPYDTWAKAAASPATVAALNPAGGPHAVYIAPGTYNAVLYVNSANWAGSSFIGTSAHGVTTPAAKGQVVLAGTTAAVINNAVGDNVTVKNLTANGGGSAYSTIRIRGANFTADNVKAMNSGLYLLDTNNAANFKITNFEFAGSSITADYAVRFDGTSSGTLAFGICHGNGALRFGMNGGIYSNASGTINLYNIRVDDYKSRGINQAGSGTTNVINSIVGQPISYNGFAFQRVAGTLNIQNSLALPTWDRLHNWATGTVATDSNNIKTNWPGVNRHARSGFIVPVIDDLDAIGSAYLAGVEASLAARGMKGSIAVQAYQASAKAADLIALYGTGTMSIEGHSYSHSNLARTGNLFSVTKASATINVDRTANTITVSPGGTLNGYKTMVLASIMGWLSTVGVSASTTPADIYNGAVSGEVIADTLGAQSINTAYYLQLLIDPTAATGYYKYELVDSKAVLETLVAGLTVRMLATPGCSDSADLKTAVRNAGYWGERGAQEDDAGQTYLLDSFKPYNGVSFAAIRLIGADDAGTVANAKALAQLVAESGAIFYVFAHNFGGSPDFTNAQWDMVLDVWKQYPEITVTSAADALNTIRNGGLWSTADNITWTRAFTDQGDYRLRGSSPARNSGTDTVWSGQANVTDFRGVKITDGAGSIIAPGGFVDIGAYEYRPQQGSAGLLGVGF